MGKCRSFHFNIHKQIHSSFHQNIFSFIREIPMFQNNKSPFFLEGGCLCKSCECTPFRIQTNLLSYDGDDNDDEGDDGDAFDKVLKFSFIFHMSNDFASCLCTRSVFQIVLFYKQCTPHLQIRIIPLHFRERKTIVNFQKLKGCQKIHKSLLVIGHTDRNISILDVATFKICLFLFIAVAFS